MCVCVCRQRLRVALAILAGLLCGAKCVCSPRRKVLRGITRSTREGEKVGKREGNHVLFSMFALQFWLSKRVTIDKYCVCVCGVKIGLEAA